MAGKLNAGSYLVIVLICIIALMVSLNPTTPYEDSFEFFISDINVNDNVSFNVNLISHSDTFEEYTLNVFVDDINVKQDTVFLQVNDEISLDYVTDKGKIRLELFSDKTEQFSYGSLVNPYELHFEV